jgi:hypothetical protein
LREHKTLEFLVSDAWKELNPESSTEELVGVAAGQIIS